MNVYNKIMQVFWLLVAITIIIYVTVMGYKEGFDRWSFNYIFAGLAFAVYLLRRFMMKRMKKHQAFLDKQAKEKK